MRKYRTDTKLCECGCGTEMPKWKCNWVERKYVLGHQRNGKKFKYNFSSLTDEDRKETKLCECGCGEEILRYDNQGRERRFKNYHQTKGENHPMLGKKHSEETKRYYSEDRKGRINPPHVCEMISKRNEENWKDPVYREKMLDVLEEGKKKYFEKGVSEETRKKMSMSQIKAWSNPECWLSRSMENSPLWKGGYSYKDYCDIFRSNEFKNEIKERDEYKCNNPLCKGEYKRLAVHHIDYDKGNCHPHNLITVCTPCNTMANTNRDFWKSHYENIMNERFNDSYYKNRMQVD